jgi:hypothetical protein
MSEKNNTTRDCAMNTEIVTASDQLRQIHSLMESGNKNVWLERHTLFIWGVTIGLVIALTGTLTMPLYRQNFWLGISVEHLLIGALLFGALKLDYRLTRTKREKRDETFSLIQKRITFVVWMLFLFAFLLSFYSVMKLGGGSKVLGMHVVLAGITLLIVGQFSQVWYKWAGSGMLLLGIVLIFAFHPGTTLRIVVATSFIVGSSYCAWVTPYATSSLRCGLLVLGKYLVIAMAALLVHQVYDRFAVDPGDLPRVSYQEYLQNPGGERRIVVLPAGTRINFEIEIRADVILKPAVAKATLITKSQLEMVAQGKQLTGIFRTPKSAWVEARNAVYVKRFIRQTGLVKDNRPFVIRKIFFGTRRRYGGLISE